jgi:hypothetical protein
MTRTDRSTQPAALCDPDVLLDVFKGRKYIALSPQLYT